jgi:glycerol-3-phosphate dehydrogenase
MRRRVPTSLPADIADHLERLYGDEAGRVLDLAATFPGGLLRIHPAGPDVWAQVAYAVESEWVRQRAMSSGLHPRARSALPG